MSSMLLNCSENRSGHRAHGAAFLSHGPAIQASCYPLPFSINCPRQSLRVRAPSQGGFVSKRHAAARITVRNSHHRLICAGLAADVGLSATVTALALALLQLLQQVTGAGYIPRVVNRKIVHVTCAPLMFASWPFYSASPYARIIAAAVPAIFIFRILTSALASSAIEHDNSRVVENNVTAFEPASQSFPSEAGSASNENLTSSRTAVTLVESLARADDAKGEVLRGPLFYVIALLAITLFCWRTDPASPVAISQLCFGDGFADIIGRRFGSQTKWPFRRAGGKSVVGTLAFFSSGFIGSSLLLRYPLYLDSLFNSQNGSASNIPSQVPALLIISFCCALVELLVPEVDDNFSVPATAIVLSHVLGIKVS